VELRKHASSVPALHDTFSAFASQLFNNYTFSDISIVCSDRRTFPAHRNIIALRSPVFQLTTEMRPEAVARRSTEIIVSDIDGETMLELLRYIYTTRVDSDITHSVARKLIFAAAKYNLKELKSICASKLIAGISAENAIETLLLAKQYREGKLMRECIDCIDM
jgi:glutamine synthetase type III